MSGGTELQQQSHDKALSPAPPRRRELLSQCFRCTRPLSPLDLVVRKNSATLRISITVLIYRKFPLNARVTRTRRPGQGSRSDMEEATFGVCLAITNSW